MEYLSRYYLNTKMYSLFIMLYQNYVDNGLNWKVTLIGVLIIVAVISIYEYHQDMRF